MSKFRMDTPFSVAEIFVMPFGKYKGKSLTQIAETDEGLRYLDWAADEMKEGYVGDCIAAFVRNPEVSAAIDDAISCRKSPGGIDREWKPRDWSWLKPASKRKGS